MGKIEVGKCAEVAVIGVENPPAEAAVVDEQENALNFSADGDMFRSLLKQALRAPSNFKNHIAPICIQANAEGLGIRIINDGFSICAVAKENEKIFSCGEVVIPRKAAEKLLGLSLLNRYQFYVNESNMFCVDDAEGETILSLTTYTQGTKGHELFHRLSLFNNFTGSLSVQQDALKDVLDKTTYAIGGKIARQGFQFLYFKAQGNELTVSATDGFHMAIANAHLLNVADATFCINREAAEFLRKFLASTHNSPLVSIDVGEIEIQFKIGNSTLTTKTLLLTPPPFEKLIPASDDIILTSFFSEADIRTIRSFCKLAKSIIERVIFEFGDDGIDMKATPFWNYPIETLCDFENGVAVKQSIQASNKSEFTHARAAVNPKYLSDALSTQRDDGIIELTREYIIVRTSNSIAVIAPIKHEVDGKMATIEFSNAPLKETDAEKSIRTAKQAPQHRFNPFLGLFLEESKGLQRLG